jgi:hypothetical protein
MRSIAALLVLAACALPTTYRPDRGRTVTYAGPTNCDVRCASTPSGRSCERICTRAIITEPVARSCSEKCASSESRAPCIAECEQPPRICGTTRPPSHATGVVVTTLAVIEFSLVGVLAAEYALDR